MEYLVISLVSLVVAALTFFSGFGLGTLLMPAFALFFPIEIAIAATAVVHLLNNVFKVYLVGKSADKKIVMQFAIPAAAFAMIGAWLLNYFTILPAVFSYSLGNTTFYVSPVKLIIAALMIIFAIVELIPILNKISFKSTLIPVGGALSGFFGGLSGHQGALRTAFLVRLGLQKKVLIGNMVLSAVIVDVARLLIYGLTFFERDFRLLYQQDGLNLVLLGSLAAFIGSFFGAKILDKITLKFLQLFIAGALLVIAVALGMGFI
jgi:uncharacterized membrane protein YfcA